MVTINACKQISLAALLTAFLLSVSSCAVKQPGYQGSSSFVRKPLTPLPVQYCVSDATHIAGSKPYILGGRCACTPSPQRFKSYQQAGHLQGYSYDGFLQLYKQRGIQTGLDHQDCNNLCKWGPHVIFGGSCMVPPTPATQNYEAVILGKNKKSNNVSNIQ